MSFTLTIIGTEILLYGTVECPRCNRQQPGPEPDAMDLMCQNCEYLMQFRFCQSDFGMCDRRAAIRVRGAYMEVDGTVMSHYVCSECYSKKPALLGEVITLTPWEKRE